MKNEEMALLFSEATPYIQKYHGKTLVIKYGGNAMVNEELKLAVMNDLVTLTLLGVRVVLVHGGGPAINQMLNRVGKESKFVNGLRYTDKETMSIVQQVLAGQVNKDLVALLKGRGVGLCGLDGHTITCSRKSDVDLGYVGNVEKVDTTLIEHLLNDGFIPVIATVGMDENGIACSRLELTPDGLFRAKGGARFGNLLKYEPGKTYKVEVELSVANRMVIVYVDGKKVGQRMFFAPVPAIERVMFRTGAQRTYPTVDTPADWYGILPDAGEQEPLCTYRIANFKTASADKDAGAAFLKYKDFKPYVDYFNSMEDENIAQAIPNARASQWMEENIPLFECSQKNFEEMYYYRWWTLRKHIKETPVGYGMTEFLVNRSYADKYNLIACAIGHHIYESRWLRNPEYLNQIIHTWYRGNEGGPMAKMTKFSSWNADAVLGRYMVDGNKEFLLDMVKDLEAEYARWEKTNRLPNGLYWQGDVQDGMEESISGGRRKQYARPTINSYMYGNAKALSLIGIMTGDEGMAMKYGLKADSIKTLVQDKLWNTDHHFFETMRGDASA